MLGSALHACNINVTSDQIGMSNGTGKGKERLVDADKTGIVEQASAVVSPSSSTIFERVVASTTGLASSVFSAPTSHEVHASASAAQSSTGKGQQRYHGSSSAWSEGSGAAGQRQAHSVPPASFRGTHTEEHIAIAEAEFSSFLNDVPALDASTSAIWGLDDTAHGLANLQTTTHIPFEESEDGISRRIASQRKDDGQDVIKVLSDPKSSIIVNEEVKDEPVVWTMTESQRAEWQQRLKHDFPQDAYQPRTLDHPGLNLNPRAEGFDTALVFGSNSNSMEHKAQWIGAWHDVLYHYRDEVWGDLLPLVKEARQEVEQLKNAPVDVTGNGSKALRRLGQLLGHINQT